MPSLITASQEFQTTDLDISYKVTDADDANVTTGILAYVDGDKSFDNVIVAKTFIGDVLGKSGGSGCQCHSFAQLGYASGLE